MPKKRFQSVILERRFVRQWERLEARRDAGENLRDVLRASRADALIAALATAGGEDRVAANAIATELLNRLRRAPYLGAAIASTAIGLALFALEFVHSGTPLVIEDAGVRAYALVATSVVVTGFSFLAWGLWYGFFPRLRARLEEPFLRDY